MRRTLLRLLSCLMLMVFVSGQFAACSRTMPSNDGKLKITTTVFAEYDWVRNILGDRINDDDCELIMLLNKGVDSHSFEPTAHDILEIATSDIFVYVGGESDSWVEDCLSENLNDSLIAVSLIDRLDSSYLREEEVVEGMQTSEENDEDEIAYDEHIWLSFDNAISSIEIIKNEIINSDPDNKDLYEANASSYINQLTELRDEALGSKLSGSTIVVADRFPFRYLCDELDINYYAAFLGCEAETEATFETVIFLSDKLYELRSENVFVIDGSDRSLAQTVIDNSGLDGVDIRVLDSMQSVTSEDINNGTTYIGIMRENISILTDACEV